MQNYRIPLSEISPSGKDMTLDDPAIWQGPLAEFRMDCRIIDPLKAELGIMPLEGGYLVRGSITGTVVLPCNRCAEDVTVTVDSHFENFEETAAEPEDEEAATTGEDLLESRVVVENGVSYLDLGAICWEEFVLALPVNPLCRPDCKGLCPHCGQDLNEGSCDCSQKPDPLNPFAALAGLSFSDDDVARGQAAAQEYGDAVASLPPEEPPELSPEEAAELEKALSAIFEDGAEGYLEFDEQGNLVFIEEEPEEPGE